MIFLKYVFLLSVFVFTFLFVTINLSTPPALSAQVNMKTMSVIKLNTYADNYTSDYWPWWSSWWAGSYGWK